MLSEEDDVLFSCPENTGKEENEDQVNQSNQGIDHMLAETAECLNALQVGEHVSSSCFLPVLLSHEDIRLFHCSLHQTVYYMTNDPLYIDTCFCKSIVMNVYFYQVLSVLS